MASLRTAGRVATRSLESLRISVAKNSGASLARPFSAMVTSEPVVRSTLRRSLPLQGFNQQRGMVLVTKSKASDAAAQEKEDGQSKKADLSDYKILSEDLIITPSCIARVDKLIQQRKAKDGITPFLRVFVDAGGCSGFQYQFEFDQDYDPEEDITLVVSASEDVPRIVSDQASIDLLRGSTLDYVQEMIKSSFVVSDNPQSESACGCGSSFAVKNFASNPALD